MSLTTKQKKVYDKALSMLKHEKWYRGVCMDNFPTDKDIERDGTESCASDVFMETAYWDGPTL